MGKRDPQAPHTASPEVLLLCCCSFWFSFSFVFLAITVTKWSALVRILTIECTNSRLEP